MENLQRAQLLLEPETKDSKLEICLCLGFMRHGFASFGSGSNKVFEEPRCKHVLRRPAFRMPLDAHNPIRIPGPFDGFDGSIGSMRSDTQFLPRMINRLMVAAINTRFN